MPTNSSDLRAEHDASDQELAAIVLRAERLGFCGWRVATALRMTAHAWATLEGHGQLTTSARAHTGTPQIQANL
jgi:hypothetical protein